MKKKFFSVISIILVVAILIHTNGFGFFAPKTAYAVGDLNIIWGVPTGDPIFVVENMLPGDTESRDVDVSNSGTVARDVGIRGEKTEEFASFSTILDFVISENGTHIYGGTSSTGPKTLAQFFTDTQTDPLLLSTIPSGDSTTYTFTATFPTTAGNEFQNARVVFDLIIGIMSTVPAECSHIEFDGDPIFGTSKSDKILGTNGNDLIFALEGHDHVEGKNGDDCIVGGIGHDHLEGNNGNDVVLGDAGDDHLEGNNGNDELFGGVGKDKLIGGNGNDYLDAGAGDDSLEGNNGDDELHGGPGKDSLKGGNGNDKMFGGDNNDNLVGEAGDDYLDGEAGNDDRTDGSSGTDTCFAEVKVRCELP